MVVLIYFLGHHLLAQSLNLLQGELLIINDREGVDDMLREGAAGLLWLATQKLPYQGLGAKVGGSLACSHCLSDTGAPRILIRDSRISPGECLDDLCSPLCVD